MKYYKYQIKVLGVGTADQVTLGLNTSENVNNFVATMTIRISAAVML